MKKRRKRVDSKEYTWIWLLLIIITIAVGSLTGCDYKDFENAAKILEELERLEGQGTFERPKGTGISDSEFKTPQEDAEQSGSMDQSSDAGQSDSTDQSELVQGEMAVHFLDVGQGLSIFIQCDGLNMIYDGGDRDTSSMVVAYLKNMGVETIDYLISSHYDSDHVAGLIGCLNVFDVKNVISADYVHDSKTYQSFVDKVGELGLAMQHPAVGTEYEFGSAKFVILAPETIRENESNENSVAIKLIHGENSFVITGDAEHKSEEAMCNSGINLECDVLVPGHHGSATATSWDFLMKTVPEYAVISCGEGNSYGHPHAETMEKLESMEVQVYRTDKQGFLSVVSDGKTLTWSQEPCNDYSDGEE